MKKRNVRIKITLWYTVGMALIVAIFLILIFHLQRKNITEVAQSRLSTTVGITAEKCKLHLEDMLEKGYISDKVQKAPKSFPYYSRGIHILILGEDFQILSNNLPFADKISMELENNTFYIQCWEEESYYLYSKRITLSNKSVYWICGIIPASTEEYAIDVAERSTLILAFLLIVLAAVGGYVMLNRMFMPIRKMTLVASEIAESKNLSKRLSIQNKNNEFGQLAEMLDGMLDRIEDLVEREKQFTSDASHELRTPVTVILSECEYLKECEINDKECEASIAAIERQAKKMSILIKELLALSRMDKNTLKPHLEMTDVSELVRLSCEEQEQINDSSIRLITDIEDGIFAEVDNMLLLRLLSNLISNAYTYNRSAGEIRVVLKREEGFFALSVADTGIGIAKEHLTHIWERFYQVNPARFKNTGIGAGLGLSMVKWIAQTHGGVALVTSELGVGSEFTVKIPIR